MTEDDRTRLRGWWIAVFAVVYLAAVLLGNRLHYANPGVATIWPASGVLLGALIVSRSMRWPAIVAIAFVAHLGADAIMNRWPWITGHEAGGWQLIGGIAGSVSTVLGAVLGAFLLRLLIGPTSGFLVRLRGVVAFIVVGVVGAPAVAALIGAFGVALTEPSVDHVQVWQTWWFANGIGVLTTAPLVIGWLRPAAVPRSSLGRRIEFTVVLVLIGCAAHFILGRQVAMPRSILEYPALLMPLLIWVTLRFPPRAPATALFVLALMVAAYADQELGPFVFTGLGMHAHVLAMQAYLATTAVTMLILAAAIGEHRAAQMQLESEVGERTRSEAQQRTLMNELDHRVKNNLSSILSLIDHSRSSPASLSTRVHAMAQLHEMLAVGRWNGMTLHRMIGMALAPVIETPDGRVTIAGDDVAVTLQSATPLMLALHELAVNAARHGALGHPEGTVEIVTKREGDTTTITWQEQAQRVSTVTEGTGLSLVRGFVTHELGGALTIEPGDSGLGIEFRLPSPVDERAQVAT